MRRKPREFAAMVSAQKTQPQPCYQRLLVRFGIVTPDVSIPQAFSAWTRVAADPDVLRLKQRETRSKSKCTPKLFAATEAALASMTSAQLAALRHRLAHWPNA